MPGMEERPSKEGSLHFDRTVSLGHVLTIVALMSSLVGAYVAYKVTISNHEDRISRLETLMLQQLNTNQDQVNSLWSIKQDVAVIKDRIERFSSSHQR